MIKGSLVLYFLMNVVVLFSQKPPLDLSVYTAWTGINWAQISNDGKYSLSIISNLPQGKTSLVLKANDNSWELQWVNVLFGQISANSEFAIFKSNNDSLAIVKLGTSEIQYIANVATFSIAGDGDVGWFVYQKKNEGKIIFLHDVKTGKEQRIDQVSGFLFGSNGKSLIVEREEGNGIDPQALHWVNFNAGTNTVIWRGRKSGAYAFDASDSQLVFIGMEPDGQGNEVSSIWYYKKGMESARLELNNDMVNESHSGMRINGSGLRFGHDGNRIFFTMEDMPQPKKTLNNTKVNIWSYSDAKIQSLQQENPPSGNYAFVLNLDGHLFFRIEQKNETMPHDYKGKDDFILVMQNNGDPYELYWSQSSTPLFYLVSAMNGTRKLLNENHEELQFCSLSPDNRYVVYYNTEQRNYFALEIASGTLRNISKLIKVPLFSLMRQLPGPVKAVGVAGWMENDEAVFINDNYDIWQVDPQGKSAPLNVTQGIGLKHNLNLIIEPYANSLNIAKNSTLFLKAFDNKSKDEGFFSVALGSAKPPEKLSMGPYFFNRNLQKAKEANVWITMRGSATESPNLFSTRDAVNFVQLTNVHPESKYNWLTVELKTWRDFKGKMIQGALFKPEDFDPDKKYPVIFYFYERLTREMNRFKTPEMTDGTMDISYYVSNGYLVFTPDIYYELGKPGESAYNSIVSAAKYLSKFPWVDSSKLGLQGDSWGGFEVNYLVTHTNMFAAASPSAGPSDMISGYGEIWQGVSNQHNFEAEQSRIGYPLYARPDLYIKNSPIFRVDKVATPILIMHNKEDHQAAWAQGLGFFMGLRRLGKKVWMLQYDNQGHGITRQECAMDFTIRQKQFFDYYLKGAQAPRWMVEGLPANVRDTETRYELEPKGVAPGPGLDLRK